MNIKLTDLLVEMLAEEEQTSTQVQEMLERFKSLKSVLHDLLTSSKEDDYNRSDDIGKLVSGIEVIVFKPTTFKITFKNGSTMNLKYDPTPMELDPKSGIKFKARDYFQCQILGKKFSLGNRSEYLEALNYIAKALGNKPVGTGDNQNNQEPDDSGDQQTPDEKAGTTPDEKS